MDIIAFLENFNRQLDARRREPFASHGYPLRPGIEPVALLDELLLLEEDLHVVEKTRFGELELLSNFEEFDWPFGLLENPQDLELVPGGRPVSGVGPVGDRLPGLAATGTTD